MEIKGYVKLDDPVQIEGYESPIQMYIEQVENEAIKASQALDENCFQAVINYGIDVDKAELIKALKYDRGQYDKGYVNGYAAGQRDAVKHGHWIEQEAGNLDTYYTCSACKEDFCLIEGEPSDNLWNYCPNCGAKMDEEVTDDN